MLPHRFHKPWLVIARAVTVILALAVLAVGLLARLPGSDAAFVNAQQRWQARPFSRYQMVLVDGLPGERCLRELEIQAEVVVAVRRMACSIPRNEPARPVTALFEQIRPYAAGPTCGPNGCACDRLVLDVTYDPQWGYPKEVHLRQVEPSWWSRMWGRLRGINACTLIGINGLDFEVQSLTPVVND